MKIRIDTFSYNHRRHGRPWIAQVNFRNNPKGDYQWGKWIGDSNTGGEGILEIEANEGDFLATGQKDFRKSSNSSPTFYKVLSNGDIEKIGDKGQAYKYFLSTIKEKNNKDLLIEEKERLLKRIREIDEILKEE